MNTPNNITPNDKQYTDLLAQVGNLLQHARTQVAQQVNTVLVNTYWQIGQYIVEYEQNGQEKSVYGSKLIDKLSADLTAQFGKGFGRSNLRYMRKFYLAFPNSRDGVPQIGETVSHQLSWGHYYEILKADDPLEISFYCKQCAKDKWSVRELKRQMKSMLFHRLALSKDKEGVLRLANEGIEVQKPEDIIRDPYVLEFVGLPDRLLYKEGELEDALVNNLSQFMLELGKGFAYVGRQYRLSLGGRHFYVDLVFYNVLLKCYCLIDLKRGTVQHEDIGQMNLYLNYFQNEVNTEGDNPPVGIVLGAYADSLTIEYAMGGISNQLFVSRYQLYLPSREMLESKLQQLIDKQEE